MDIQTVTEELNQMTEERDWDQFHSPENLAKSIVIEGAELLECFQWDSNYDLEQVKAELADVLSYCLMLCDKLNLDPAQIVHDKLQATLKKYPVEKAKGKNTKYTDL